MNKEKLIRIAEKRRQAYLKKEEETSKMARKIQKGMATIRDMYLTFNTPECGEDKDIDVPRMDMGGEEHPFSAGMVIYEKHGVISLGFWRGDAFNLPSVKIGDSNSVFDPDHIMKVISESKKGQYLSWILLHADEFCDMVIAELEKQYEDIPKPEEEGKEYVLDMDAFEKAIAGHEELEPYRDLLAKLIRESGGDLVHYLDDYCSKVMVENLLLPDMITILNSSSYYGSIRVFQTIEDYCQYLLGKIDLDWDTLSSVIYYFMDQSRRLNGPYSDSDEFVEVDTSEDLTAVRLISLDQLCEDFCKAVHGEGGQDVIISSYELLNADETISLYARHYKAIHEFWGGC